ncbi:hypothetical protein ABZ642_24370 [Streptomyces sp. NPDC007157]|uniref:hypothetical protein n=1 Tax=Streptomyces sp. NPDC007157 TaxID=3154681 RepID=UPI003411E91F
MRKFQRAAVVAAAIAGLSFVGAGASFAAGGEDAGQGVTAVANSSANAVAVGSGYYGPAAQPQGQPEAQPEAQPQGQPEGQPEEQKAGPDQSEQPEQGYGQQQGGEGE